MPKPRKITQRTTLALIRKPLPPRGRVILDKVARLRRKRVKRVDPDGYQTPSQFNQL